MFDCEACSHQHNCEIRENIIEVENDYGVKLRLGYCPEFHLEDVTVEQIDLLDLFPDDQLDPDDFSREDLA